MKIAVIHGGTSSESAKSTKNAQTCYEHLQKMRHDAYLLEYNADMIGELLKNRPDIVLLCVQGKGHGDGTLQGILDYLEIPYTGSKHEAATLINNKIFCQKLFKAENISVAPFFVWSENFHRSVEAKKEFLLQMQMHNVTFPCLAKAPSQGGGVGIELLKSIDDFKKIELVFQYDTTILIEKFMTGAFYTVALLNYRGNLFVSKPFKDEVQHEDGSFIAPTDGYLLQDSNISEEMSQSMMYNAKKAFDCTNAYGYARIDFMIDEDTNIANILEINAVPGLRPESMFYQIMKFHDIEYHDMLEAILQSAF